MAVYICIYTYRSIDLSLYIYIFVFVALSARPFACCGPAINLILHTKQACTVCGALSRRQAMRPAMMPSAVTAEKATGLHVPWRESRGACQALKTGLGS